MSKYDVCKLMHQVDTIQISCCSDSKTNIVYLEYYTIIYYVLHYYVLIIRIVSIVLDGITNEGVMRMDKINVHVH